MAEQDSLKTSMAALALALESAVAGVGDLPALAQIFAAATGGGENACGKARLGLCHGGKKGERRYDCLPKPEERLEGSVRMHCLHNFWGAEGGNSNLCCGNPPARRRCSESGKRGRCWRTPTCRQRPRGPTRTGNKRVGKEPARKVSRKASDSASLESNENFDISTSSAFFAASVAMSQFTRLARANAISASWRSFSLAASLLAASLFRRMSIMWSAIGSPHLPSIARSFSHSSAVQRLSGQKPPRND